MTMQEFLAQTLEANLKFINMTVADLTDADLMVRPCPAANHACWQLGHLAGADLFFVTACGGPAVELPAGWREKFTNKNSVENDQSKLATKTEILAALAKSRANSVAWVKTLSDADLAKPAPEPLKGFCFNVADAINTIAIHSAMHLGQIQAIRRKLGKPILF